MLYNLPRCDKLNKYNVNATTNSYFMQWFGYSRKEFWTMSWTTQKMKFSIKYFFSKCGQIFCFLRIWSHLPKKSVKENFIYLWWGFFARIGNDFQPITIFGKMLHHKRLAEFYIRLCIQLKHQNEEILDAALIFRFLSRF